MILIDASTILPSFHQSNFVFEGYLIAISLSICEYSEFSLNPLDVFKESKCDEIH
mgnify:CR=1 FL=1